MQARLRPTLRKPVLALVVVVCVSLLASAAAFATGAHSTAGDTLVIDKNFDLKTADPQRQFEVTGGIIAHALYSTLLEFKGRDVKHPRPAVASRFTASKDAKTYTFFLRKDVHFSDGSPLTSNDVVFSYRRLVNLKGSPSFLLEGISVSAKGKYAVVVKSKTPNPAIPALVANPSLGIVNSAVVKAHGGTDAAGADKKDKAEAYLNSNSAGSGPYVLESFNTTSRVVLKANPRYWRKKPHFETVVIRNVTAPAQLLNVQRGTNEIALDLSPQQAKSLRGVQVERTPSANVFFLFANANPKVSKVTSNVHIRNAIRYALDYQGYVKLAGAGAVQPGSVIPTVLLGGLPSAQGLKQNLAKARAEVAASGISNPTASIEYPSDFTLNGLSFSVLAQKVKSDLAKVGITVNLKGSPIATSLDTYRAGTEELGVWEWSPDYPDPNDYLVFLPGKLVGLRTGWAAGSEPALEALGKRASTVIAQKARVKVFHQIQTKLNRVGPLFPVVQPGQVVASSKNLTGAVFNVQYWLDVAGVGSR